MNRLIKVFILICLACAVASSVSAAKEGDDKASLDKIFSDAGNLYEMGKYDVAIGEYNKILKSGYDSGVLEFNLGNAYFKKGDLGHAILSYERAKRIMPRDADLKANLSLAKAKIKGNVEENMGLLEWRPLKMCLENISANEIVYILSAIYLALLLFILLALYRPVFMKNLVAVIIILALLFSFNFYIAFHKIRLTETQSIVIAPEIEAKFAPIDSATKFFNLYEGMDVIVLSEKNGWAKVKRSDGKVGWINKTGIEAI